MPASASRKLLLFLHLMIFLAQLFWAHSKKQIDFDFECIRASAEPSSRNSAKTPLDSDWVEQKSGHKKLKGRLLAKKQIQGFLFSRGYPSEGYLNQKCAVELEAPARSGLVLHITFVDVDLEERYSRSAQCLRDYLVLTIIDRDGREHTSERICGNEKPEAVRSMQSKARLLFVASSTSSLGNSTRLKRRKGFKLRYEFVPEATILAPSSLYFDSNKQFRAECGGINSPTALSGEIHSPGFPFTYPRNVTCFWLLRVASHRRLYIRILDLELAPTVAECDRASLHLQDGYRHDLQNRQKEEESWATAIVSSTGAKRKAPKGGGMEAADADFCGGSQYYGEEGMKSYMSEGNRVLVKFVTRDGPSQEQLARYQKKRTPIGFRLLWTEVESLVATASDVPGEEPDPEHPSIVMAEQCPGFVCLGGTFCVDNLDSICVERTRLCINETLRCDGVPNCAENDESDEAYCYSQNPVKLSALALLLVALICLLLLTTFCILRHLSRPKRGKRMERRVREVEEAPRANGQPSEWQRRRSSRLNEQAGGKVPAVERGKKRRRLSDTRMRKLQICTVSSTVVEGREVRTNVIPATPPILGLENGGGGGGLQLGWKELDIGGNIVIRDLDLERQQHFEENNNNAGVLQELPCLCPIQNGGNAPKVRLVSRDRDTWQGEEHIWERRRSAASAASQSEVASGKDTGNGQLMESWS